MAIAVAAALLSTTGAVLGRIQASGEPPISAFLHHFADHFLSAQIMGSAFVLFPFIGVALICAAVEKRSRTRSSSAIFGLALLMLLYFYFTGYLESEVAMAEERWTAAALGIGLLPFFIGIPALLAVAALRALAARFDRRTVGSGTVDPRTFD